MKNSLIQTSFDLFTKYGIDRISMDDIAQELSISKKTIYKFFISKDHLLEASFRFYLDQFNNLPTVQNSMENSHHEFSKTFNIIVKRLTLLSPSFFKDIIKYPQANAIWNEFQLHFILLLEGNIRRGLKEQVYHHETQPEITARLFVSQLDSIFNSLHFPKDQYNLQEVYDVYVNQFLRGIMAKDIDVNKQACERKSDT